MPVLGLKVGDEYLAGNEAIRRALRNPLKYGDPLIVREALRNRNVEGLSVTELFGHTRLTLFKKLVWYYVTLEDAWAAIRGRWVHALFESVPMREGQQPIREIRLRQRVGEHVISGQIDCFWPEDKLLVDYKTTNRIPSQPYDTHVLQVNAYAWLLREAGYDVRRIVLVYISFDRFRLVEVDIYEHGLMTEVIGEQVDFMVQCLAQRALPPSTLACHPSERYWCQFYPLCQANQDWVTLPSGELVWVEGKLWTMEEWVEELLQRQSEGCLEDVDKG